VRRVFDALVAPDFEPEGVQEFLNFISPSSLVERTQQGTMSLVAELDGELAGVLQIRDHSHLCLLFVEQRFHGKGVARALFEAGIAWHRSQGIALPSLTVNSSVIAVPAYRKLGFEETGTEQMLHGILHVPMRAELDATKPED